jgi:lactosylceramide 4-alpha-galactosyltransferase
MKKKNFAKVLAVLAFIAALKICLDFPEKQIKFFELNHLKFKDFDDISNAKVQPESGKNIFFIDSGQSEGNVTLNIRQCCSIESAALMNPQLNIFVLFTSQERLKSLTRTPEVEAILSYKNVHLNSIDVVKFSIGTTFEEFFLKNALNTSLFKVEHTSDIVRIMVLWKYGGTYLDNDVITKQKLDSLPLNYACAASDTIVANGLINFQSINDNFLVGTFADDLIRNFNGSAWSINGPLMMIRVLQKLCNTTQTVQMVSKGNCKGFHVLPRKACLAINWSENYRLMKDSEATETMKVIKDSTFVHFANKMSKNQKLLKSQKAAYIQLAYQFCPKVMAQEGETF